MLYYFIALLTTAVVMLAGDPRSRSTRWLAFFLVCASFGGLAAVLPNVGTLSKSDILSVLTGCLEFVNRNVTPYGVLMFAIAYTEPFPVATERRWAHWLALPVLGMAVAAVFGLSARQAELVRLVWVGLYYIGSVWLLLRGWLGETNRLKRKSRLLTLLLIAPTVIAILLFVNIGRALDPLFPFFPYVAWFIGYSLGAGLLFALLGGALGLRIRLERADWDSAWQAARTGTAMLNHAIKNEAGKIALCTDNLSASPQLAGADEHRQLAVIAAAADHLLALSTRLQELLRELRPAPEPTAMRPLLERCLIDAAESHAGKQVRFALEDGPELILRVDPELLRETIANLLHNAVEAMPVGGQVSVALYRLKRAAAVDIRDEGCGIPKQQLERVLEPFYSTKRTNRNFGLGLSFCFSFMRLSGGTLKLDSEPGRGTTVRLLFPAKRIIERRMRHARTDSLAAGR